MLPFFDILSSSLQSPSSSSTLAMIYSTLLIASALASSAVFAAPTPDPLLNIELDLGSGINLSIGGGRPVKEPKEFTSAFSVRAVPETIITNDGVSVPGQTGALGHYAFKINSKTEEICYEIRLVGVDGAYSSKALTATHIHQAAAGAAGPPRIAFPNPAFVRKNHLGQEVRESKGCMKGPFRTGINTTAGIDTGSATGFTLSQIEANPSGFFADTHTEAFIAGAVRGQLLRSELEVASPKSFDAVLTANAQPDNVVTSANVPVAGQEGASGDYKLKINLKENVVCYSIEVKGLEGEYFSPAKTATHVHFASAGLAGPPRLAFRNPQPVKGLFGSKNLRRSEACIKGPFTSGLTAATGLDTSTNSGFTLQQLVDNPSGFFADTHTEKFAAGAIRGQLVRTQ
ncbi:hypothetical protein CF319_g6056 [Tilletia indica]|uniref:CHRD domain-containing protein n=1 Tax=Tilletia indica TaxID=43049 RepID=A0A8T8SQA5_9BASI|nr:hypothetical protein CF319_g6056 [Tilletia indica]KAE8245439.1 hypothetical protein A4X13_0g5919 [Tilletia indica]